MEYCLGIDLFPFAALLRVSMAWAWYSIMFLIQSLAIWLFDGVVSDGIRLISYPNKI